MAVPWPVYAVKFFEFMLSSHGEASFIPNIFELYVLDMVHVTKEKLNSRFFSYGYESSNFLILSGKKLTMFAVMLILYPFVHYMAKRFSDKHVLCKPWAILQKKYVYTIPLRFFLISFASLYLAAFLNMWMMSFKNKSDTISSFAAMTVLLIMTYFPIMIMSNLQNNYKNINKPSFQQKWSSILAELDTSTPTRYAYYPVFLIRRAAFVILLVFFANSPKI